MRDNTPATGVTVTPSDGADLPSGLCHSLHVGGAGNLSVYMGPNSTTAVTIVATAGSYHPIKVRRVLSTGTTATGIVALYN